MTRITTTETDTTITAIATITVTGCSETIVKVVVDIDGDEDTVFVRSERNGKWIKVRNVTGTVENAVNAIEDHLAEQGMI